MTKKPSPIDAFFQRWRESNGGDVAPVPVPAPRTEVGMFSTTHAGKGGVRLMQIAGLGHQAITHVCLPEERDAYREQYPDAVFVGIVVGIRRE